MSFSYNRVEAFAKTLNTSQLWVLELRDMLGLDTAQDAYHALRAVLHALRDRLPLQEMAHFSSQLPMLLRGMFYEGWNPAKEGMKMKKPADFFDRVAEHYLNDPDADIPAIVAAVFELLREHVSEGELCDVATNMPASMRQMWV